MPRIEIELTSSRADGTWTWRAAGAREPKGTLDGALLHEGAQVGEVLRADVVMDVEGMTVTGVLPPKTKRAEPGRLEILGPPARDRDEVTVDRAGRAPREGRPGGRERPPRDRDRDRRAGGERAGGERAGGERAGAGRRHERAGGPSRPPGAGRAHPGDRPERGGPPPRERAPRPAPSPPPAPRPRPKRLHPGRAHRDAVMASLPPEERAIAEQVLRGGIPAVRQALEEQNAAARAAGEPEVKADALIALAEGLLPRLRAAEWRDRAEAAIADVDDVGLRDLRALVVSDAAGRDEASRELAARLRQALDERSAREREAWLGEITEALDAGRVVRALRSSCRPPEPGVRFPADLAERLGAAASDALGPDATPDRWVAVLEAVTASPVRRLVRPRGLPSDAPGELVQTARQAAERVPGLGPLVGAPPPPQVGARRPAPPPRPGRPPAARPARRPAGQPETAPAEAARQGARPGPPAGRREDGGGEGRGAAAPPPHPPHQLDAGTPPGHELSTGRAGHELSSGARDHEPPTGLAGHELAAAGAPAEQQAPAETPGGQEADAEARKAGDDAAGERGPSDGGGPSGDDGNDAVLMEELR